MGRRITLVLGVVVILIGVLSLLRVVGVVSINIGGLVGALVLVGVGVTILWGVLAKPAAEDIEEEAASVPLGSAARASVRVSHGAGRLVVDASADPGDVVTGVFAGGLEAETAREGDGVDVVMRPSPGFWQGVASPWRWSRGRGLDWRFGLSKAVPLSLRFDTGASDARIDLTDLVVSDVRLSTGASSTLLVLPKAAGRTSVKVDSGAASVQIRVPDSVAARIRLSGGLSSTSVDRTRFPSAGGVFQSPGYDTAPNRADIVVDMGVGSVTVR